MPCPTHASFRCRRPLPSRYNQQLHRQQEPPQQAQRLYQTLNDGGGGGGDNNWGRGDFDPDPLEQDLGGSGGAPPPPSDMLARIFQVGRVGCDTKGSRMEGRVPSHVQIIFIYASAPLS